MKNKTKIIFEYSNKTDINFDFGQTKYLNIKVFLKNDKIIPSEEISSITINAKKEV